MMLKTKRLKYTHGTLSPIVGVIGLGCLFVAGLLSSGAAIAAAEHDEPSLRPDHQLTLSLLLDKAVAHQPQFGVLAAGQNTANAELTFGRHWFPEAPELSGFHLGDRQFGDTGAYENEVALSFPLWAPGEKKAQTALGEAALTASDSREVEFRWQVSGILRKQLWALVKSRRHRDLAREQEQTLAELLEQVTLFTEVGDLSQADQLVTLQELAIWKAETMTLEAEYQDAVREYMAFTGLTRIPSDISETLVPQQEIIESHPALRQASDRLASARAAAEVVQQGNTARPSVQMFWRGYAGDRASPDINALGLGFAIPLGRSPRWGPEVARANEKLAQAEAQLLETRRMLDLQLHEARHMLRVTEMQLENSRAMIDAANQRHQLDKLAFELGEFGVHEWLRRLTKLKEIQRTHELLQVQRDAAISAYNQAAGKTL